MNGEGELDLAVVPRETLEREARRNRPIGALAVLAVIASFAALIILVGSQTAGTQDTASLRSLQQADSDSGALWGAVGLRSLSLLLTAIVAVHLVSLIAVREQTPRMMRILAIGAPILLVVATVASQVTLLDAAHTFVNGGAQTEDRAKDLLTNGADQRLTSVGTIFAAICFSVWLGWTSLAAARVGLMTRFMGYFGVGGALASVIVPVAGQGLVIGWLGSVGILLLGWWPGGRGPAWTTGQVAPWNAGADDKTPRGSTT
jgi:hypothetical protein